ncbi:ketopantoate reductase family protein [Shewanella gaetbuli]
MSIGIIGAGAIGQLLFAQLNTGTSNAHKIHLIARSPQSFIQPISFTGLDNNTQHGSVEILGQDAAEIAQLDLLIVCVKAYQVVETITPVIDRLKPNCQIMLLHNGMGPHRYVAELLQHYPDMGLSLATTSQGALKNAPWNVSHTGNGKTLIGHYCGHPLAEHFKSFLLEQIPNATWQANITTALWQKLVINCAINPLTAFYQCKNGQLAEACYQTEILTLIEECITVAKLDGIDLTNVDMVTMVNEVIHFTANNTSSMLQDINHQRPTEIAFISGYVVARAQYHGIQTPANLTCLQRIQALEH